MMGGASYNSGWSLCIYVKAIDKHVMILIFAI